MKGIRKCVIIFCLSAGLIMGTNTVFKQIKHPEIVLENTTFEIEGLGFGDPGKHPEIVEITYKENIEINPTTSM